MPTWFLLAFGILFGLIMGNCPVFAQDNPVDELNSLREKTVKLQEYILVQEAELAAEKFERKVLLGKVKKNPVKEDPAEKGDQREVESLWRKVKNVLQDNHQARLKKLRALEKEMQNQTTAALENWKNAQLAQLGFVDKVVEVETKLGQEWKKDSQKGIFDYLFNRSTLALIVYGIFIVIVGILFALHENRQKLRRRLRSAGRVGLLLLGGLVFCLPGCSSGELNRDSPRLEKQKTELERQNQTAKERLAALGRENALAEETREEWRAKIVDHWSKKFAHANLDSDEQMKEFRAQEQEMFELVHDILVGAQVVELANKQEKAVMEKLNGETQALKEFVNGERFFQNSLGGVRVVGCFLFIYLGFVFLRRVRKKRKRELAEQAIVCPCCLARDSLEPTHDKYLECSNCGYKFPENYQKLPCLCFPTVGIRASGKTHWLVTAYEQVRNDDVDAAVRFESVQSLADEEFDALVVEILENRRGSRPSQAASLPYPLVFHVRDNDGGNPNSCMLNVFDFSGEVMKERRADSDMRKRALLMDGFILFLDPTQIKGEAGRYKLSDQVKALSAFHEEMRIERELPVGAPIDIPVAVCISKLDLLLRYNPMGRSANKLLLKPLRKSLAKPICLKELQYRSKLCEKVVSALFPGWKLPRTLKDNFGGRFMLFPMSPVGIEEGELGQEDLMQRSFAPVGIMEPILWLLHMHGYTVFD